MTTPPDTPALAAQVGGDHYKTGIQPFQLSMANGHDGCTHAIQKYLTRFNRMEPDNGYKSLRKAHHICMIRVETMSAYGVPHPPAVVLIGIGDYLRSNNISGVQAEAIRRMELWFNTVDCDHLRGAEEVRKLIRAVAEEHYPDIYNEEDFSA